MSAIAGELIARCFHARTAAHIFHLKTRSYAAHKALNEFYDQIVDLADTVAETYIGCNGLIETYPAKFTMPSDPLRMLDELYDWIEKNREQVSDESHIQNEIDGICTLIDSTRYKLRILK